MHGSDAARRRLAGEPATPFRVAPRPNLRAAGTTTTAGPGLLTQINDGAVVGTDDVLAHRPRAVRRRLLGLALSGFGPALLGLRDR